jgi:hypothetical protein
LMITWKVRIYLIFMKSRSYPMRFLKNFKERYYGIR